MVAPMRIVIAILVVFSTLAVSGQGAACSHMADTETVAMMTDMMADGDHDMACCDDACLCMDAVSSAAVLPTSQPLAVASQLADGSNANVLPLTGRSITPIPDPPAHTLR